MTAQVTGPGGEVDVSDRPARDVGIVSLKDGELAAEGLSSEQTLQQVRDNIQDLENLFAAEDFASQTTLEAARALLALIEANLDAALSSRASEATVASLLTEATFTAEDFATQATLEAARVLLAAINTTHDVNLSTRASEATLSTLEGKVPDTEGTWGYAAGTSGTENIPAGARVLQITAIALEGAGAITINGGATITIPYGATDKVSSSLTIEPRGNLVAPEIVFSGTDAYFVEYVS